MRTMRILMASGVAVGLLAGCGLPGGGTPPGPTTLEIRIDWGGSPDCVEDLGNPGFFEECSDDGTVTITNTGTQPTTGRVFVSAQGVPFVTGGNSYPSTGSITSSSCTAVLAPTQSCTAQIHGEAHDTELNGFVVKVFALTGNASASLEDIHTTG